MPKVGKPKINHRSLSFRGIGYPLELKPKTVQLSGSRAKRGVGQEAVTHHLNSILDYLIL